MTLTRDPKGYYIALGLNEDCDGDAVKAAYRNKAKRLHPDFNPSPIAAKQFHRLHQAYETLSDPELRAAYDRPWRNEPRRDPPRANANENTGAYARRAEAKSEAKAERAKERPQEPKSEPRASAASATHQPATCKCGKITAQPRYIIFDLVWGRLNRVQRRAVTGVYCRSCADRTAVRSSLMNWLAGWWAWPDGPRETVKALLSNIRGGRKPPERNARLLMRQARAFAARGEMELARNAAEQAIVFATTPQLRHDVDSLLLSLSAYPSRPLKDRWAKPGWSATVQLLPLAIIVGALSMSATLLSPVSLTAMVKDFVASIELPDLSTPATPTPVGLPASKVLTGRVYGVSAKQASLRTGPGANYQLLALLNQGTVVLVTEADPGGKWLRVTTPDGASGFIDVGQLTPDVRIDALEDIGGFGKGGLVPPASSTLKP